jgi:hypothetical protein
MFGMVLSLVETGGRDTRSYPALTSQLELVVLPESRQGALFLPHDNQFYTLQHGYRNFEAISGG